VLDLIRVVLSVSNSWARVKEMGWKTQRSQAASGKQGQGNGIGTHFEGILGLNKERRAACLLADRPVMGGLRKGCV
jgi:hypothetical protein